MNNLEKELDEVLCKGNIKFHSQSVESFVGVIYDELDEIEKAKLPDKNMLLMCGRYHDIGKAFMEMMFPDLLSKKVWSKEDRETMKQHTIMGVELLMILCNYNKEDISNYLDIKNAIEYHHERLDGKGYSGLKDFPLVAQIVAVADCFCAGVENRVYAGGKDASTLLSELKEDRGLNQTYVLALHNATIKGSYELK